MKLHLFFQITLGCLLILNLPKTLMGQSDLDKYADEMGMAPKQGKGSLSSLFLVKITIPGMPTQTIGNLTGERFLPLSASSPKAIPAYHAAMELLANSAVGEYYKKMTEAIEHDAKFLMGYAFRAIELVAFDKFDEAAPFIDQAASVCSEHLTPAEQIMCKLMTKWQADSISSPAPLMDELIAAYPNTFEAYDLAGRCAYWIDNDKQKAIAYLEQAKALLPSYGPGYCLLGYSYLDTGDMKKAKVAFDTYLRLSPKEANAHDSMGDYWYKAENYPLAIKHYEKAVEMGMESAQDRADKAYGKMY